MRQLISIPALCLCLLLVAVPFGAVSADGGDVAVTGARIHTLTEAGTIENGVVLISQGRIEAVAADLAVPAGYAVFDAAGRVITPGLIESYSSLGLVEIGGELTTVDSFVREYPSGASFDVRYALNPAAVALAVNRRDGVTRAIAAPGSGNDPFAGWGALIRLGGEPLLVQPEIGLFASIGAGATAFAGGSRAAVVQRIRRGLTLAASYNANRYQPGPGDFSHQDLLALRRFRHSDAPLVIRVDRAAEIREAVSLADDFDLDLILVGGAEAWQEAELLASASVPVVVDVLANLPASYDRLGARHDNAALLQAAGVRVLLTAGESQNARKIRQMAGNAVAHGMPWQAALAAMTREAAIAWGMEKGAGTIAVGAPADLVVWTGDPLELTEWAEAVMIGGAWQDMSSRQTRLFDRYRDPADPDRAYR